MSEHDPLTSFDKRDKYDDASKENLHLPEMSSRI
jgi:hypothetical protein